MRAVILLVWLALTLSDALSSSERRRNDHRLGQTTRYKRSGEGAAPLVSLNHAGQLRQGSRTHDPEEWIRDWGSLYVPEVFKYNFDDLNEESADAQAFRELMRKYPDTPVKEDAGVSKQEDPAKKPNEQAVQTSTSQNVTSTGASANVTPIIVLPTASQPVQPQTITQTITSSTIQTTTATPSTITKTAPGVNITTTAAGVTTTMTSTKDPIPQFRNAAWNSGFSRLASYMSSRESNKLVDPTQIQEMEPVFNFDAKTTSTPTPDPAPAPTSTKVVESETPKNIVGNRVIIENLVQTENITDHSPENKAPIQKRAPPPSVTTSTSSISYFPISKLGRPEVFTPGHVTMVSITPTRYITRLSLPATQVKYIWQSVPPTPAPTIPAGVVPITTSPPGPKSTPPAVKSSTPQVNSTTPTTQQQPTTPLSPIPPTTIHITLINTSLSTSSSTSTPVPSSTTAAAPPSSTQPTTLQTVPRNSTSTASSTTSTSAEPMYTIFLSLDDLKDKAPCFIHGNDTLCKPPPTTPITVPDNSTSRPQNTNLEDAAKSFFKIFFKAVEEDQRKPNGPWWDFIKMWFPHSEGNAEVKCDETSNCVADVTVYKDPRDIPAILGG